MRNRGPRRGVRLRRADVHAAIDLRRIDADDLAGEARRERQRDRDLPAAVGPISSTVGGPCPGDTLLAAAHEQPVEIGQARADTTSGGRGCIGRRARSLPFRAAARSFPRSSGCGSRAPRRGTPSSTAIRRAAPRARASRRIRGCRAARRAPAPRRRHPAAARGIAAHRERRRADRRHSKPSASSASACSAGGRDLERLGGERRRHQQRLHRNAPVERRLQPLVDDALVGRVHVDEDQPGAVLREHVDAVQLREREPERVVFAVRQRWRLALPRSPNSRR